jgi:hypothetical protein
MNIQVIIKLPSRILGQRMSLCLKHIEKDGIVPLDELLEQPLFGTMKRVARRTSSKTHFLADQQRRHRSRPCNTSFHGQPNSASVALSRRLANDAVRWCARPDSNWRPSASEADTLSS